MLPKKYRLTKNVDFSKIYSRGTYVAFGGIGIKFLKTKNPTVRIGLAVGKNFSKKAVERNRMKRVLAQSCHPLLGFLKPGFDIVIMAMRGKSPLQISEAGEVLERIFKKANLINKK